MSYYFKKMFGKTEKEAKPKLSLEFNDWKKSFKKTD